MIRLPGNQGYTRHDKKGPNNDGQTDLLAEKDNGDAGAEERVSAAQCRSAGCADVKDSGVGEKPDDRLKRAGESEEEERPPRH